MKVVLIGSYPPPIGGNSVHVKRLHDFMRSRGLPCDVIDLYGVVNGEELHPSVYRYGPPGACALLKTLRHLRRNQYDIVHFHISALARFAIAGLLLYTLLPSSTRKVITIHSGSLRANFNLMPSFKKRIARHIFLQTDHFIPVNADQQALIAGQGVTPDKFSLIPAYLPPEPVPSPDMDKLIADMRVGSRSVVISSGSAHSLYGLHIVAAALARHAEDRNDLSLILCLYENESYEPSYLEELQVLLQAPLSFTIQNNLSPERFSYLLSKSDIYIRATTTDGDSVAIREALHFGLTVIASDAVARPSDCILFETNSVPALQALLAGDTTRTVCPDVGARHPGERIIDIYNELQS